ncbi:contractile injection system protein, VgrG/Pvc8 family [Halodesulfovibrio aestuarii]|uniref:Contractile injection system protein, VgrG/Pvc8 family n=1 Tax=Halodesulfovibrio aestuarii TaxID=126333 RepID=A0ABV4JTW9_9BACT
MNYNPAFRIEANGKDITAQLAEYFVGLTHTDSAGVESDSLTITLANPDGVIRLPATGAELRLWLGYANAAVYKGLFVVDKVTVKGPPEQLVIKANGAPFKRSGTFSALHSQKRRSWKPCKIGDLVATIAGEHGLTPAVKESLAGVTLQHLDQIDESDINLLTRVAAQHGAIAKANGGKLMFVPQAAGESASGKTLPTVSLKPGDTSTWQADISGRQNFSSVVAVWRDMDATTDREEKAGSGEPVYRLKQNFPTQAAAQKAARATLERFMRGSATLSLSMPGRPDLVAESRLSLVGFAKGVAGTWSVTQVTNSLSPSGYKTSVKGEVPLS